jgi:hypothetical protein
MAAYIGMVSENTYSRILGKKLLPFDTDGIFMYHREGKTGKPGKEKPGRK